MRPHPMGLVLFMGALLIPATAHASIFIASYTGGTISEYTNSCVLKNSALISGFGYQNVWGMAASGSDLFVVNSVTGRIGEYTTDGKAVNASLVRGLTAPIGITLSGSNIFVTDNGRVGEYTTSGIP